MMIQGDVDPFRISLELSSCINYFKQPITTTEEVNLYRQLNLIIYHNLWNTSSFSDQFPEKFCQHVIDKEKNACLNKKLDSSSDIKVDLVEQGIPKFSYFNPCDIHDTNTSEIIKI
jgi:hypothetical protein